MNPGERLHKYTIIRELGRGGMGGVYVAEEDVTGRQFAIKTLFKRFSEDEAYVRRFQREAQVYRQLDHPHIIKYIESGFDGGIYFIVLEYVRGKTLGEIMYDQGRLEATPALKIAIALAEALKHAHEKGVVHRDLKPSNVIIDESGEVKLLDFGVAHKEDQLVRTQEGTVVGTYFYAAPEQNQGKTDIDARTDIYTLGIVFYEMLVGKRPFEGDLLEVASEQAREAYTPVETLVPDIASFIPPIIRRMMARHPESRYQTAGELLEELRAALTALTSRRAPSSSLGVRPGAQVVEPDLDSGGGHPAAAAPPIPNIPPPAHHTASPVSFTPPTPTPAPTPAPAPAPAPATAVATPQASVVSMEPPPAPVASMPSAPGQGEADHRWHGAREAFQKRQLDQAQQLCEAVVANAPGFAQGQALLGKILSAKGHSFNAIESFKRALALAPQDTQMHMDYAMALYTLKLPEKARDAFETVLELDPKNMLAVRYINLLQQSGGAQPASAPAQDSAQGLGRSSLHGDVYQPPSAAPAPSAPARPQPEFGTSTAIGRLENFLAGANASASPGASSLPPPVSMTPPPLPSASPVAPPSSSSVSLPPPPASSVSPPMPSASHVSIPPPVQMAGAAEVAPPVPPIQSVSPPPRYSPPTPPPTAAPAPLKRTPEYMTPPKPMDDEPPPAVQESDGERREKRRKKRTGDDKLRYDPGKAWTLGSLWWGMGAGYLGMSTRAFMLTLLEVVVLAMILIPLTQPDMAAEIHKTKLSLVPIADWLASNGLATPGSGIYSFLYDLNKDLAPPVNGLIRDLGSDLLMGLGAILFLWFEFTLPSGFQKKAQLENLQGRVLEVRRDMTLKISLGEERGVEEGMIFRVEKRKHVDALSQLNFKTLISAPQVFPIGRAKVTSVAPTFAICQFRRYPGQSSSPSAGDQVVIMKSNS